MAVQTRPPRDGPAREVEPAPAPGPLPPGPAAGRVAQSLSTQLAGQLLQRLLVARRQHEA